MQYNRNCVLHRKYLLPHVIALCKADFTFYCVVGEGGFGKVWKVRKIGDEQLFAMKSMAKACVVNKRSIHSVLNERKLLAQLQHPFLANMHYAFQDNEYLYLCLDFLSGGDLRYHMNHRNFSESEASNLLRYRRVEFIVACVITALQYLHTRGVLHRDIKPENIVLDENGYGKITDLGIARSWTSENSQDTSGTLGYMGNL
eukprot:TRINITY_DN3413_c0_g1_i8.p1 TRINITY_DN3413_c0_g1~~TRINITY_DN3413_c0_g1_i8.p1  ORF type:complete len:201 (+),score=24.98 TRINITY_DN3413_c0_g1_i8:77-679(+)